MSEIHILLLPHWYYRIPVAQSDEKPQVVSVAARRVSRLRLLAGSQQPHRQVFFKMNNFYASDAIAF